MWERVLLLCRCRLVCTEPSSIGEDCLLRLFGKLLAQVARISAPGHDRTLG